MPPKFEDTLEKLKATPTPDNPQMKLMTLTMWELTKMISKMKKNAAAGSDTINGIVINDLFPSIRQTLLHLINMSMATGIYPNIYKITKIIPQVKPGKDESKCDSCRQFSNLFISGKPIEQAVVNQIDTFVEETEQIHPDHHGGRSLHSTSTCMIEMLECVHEAQEEKLKTGLLAIDMSSAYDLCEHDILEEKCILLSMGNDTTNWLNNFLKERSQFVELGGYRSKVLRNGKYGVIQGSPSSGKLFTYYLNDLPAQVNKKKPQTDTEHSNEKDFVDDSTVIGKGKTLEELLENLKNDYLNIYKYLINHSMAINTSKTQLMIINPPAHLDDIHITINQIKINHQNTMKILGITLSSNLSFDKHLWEGESSLTRALNAKIQMLKTVKPFIDRKALAQVGAN